MRKAKIIKTQNRQKEDESSIGKKTLLFFIFVALLVIAGFAIYKMSHQAERQDGINGEVTKLQEQIGQLEGENQDLNDLINYLKTDDFKEKEAKDKLNLIKEGEQMVLVKEEGLEEKTDLVNNGKETELIVRRENYYWWWHYFFSIK